MSYDVPMLTVVDIIFFITVCVSCSLRVKRTDGTYTMTRFRNRFLKVGRLEKCKQIQYYGSVKKRMFMGELIVRSEEVKGEYSIKERAIVDKL